MVFGVMSRLLRELGFTEPSSPRHHNLVPQTRYFWHITLHSIRPHSHDTSVPGEATKLHINLASLSRHIGPRWGYKTDILLRISLTGTSRLTLAASSYNARLYCYRASLLAAHAIKRGYKNAVYPTVLLSSHSRLKFWLIVINTEWKIELISLCLSPYAYSREYDFILSHFAFTNGRNSSSVLKGLGFTEPVSR
jgi:hypothetical protein